MTAVFGGLFGLATVASIFALLIQVFPVRDQRALAKAAAASASASARSPRAPAKANKRKRTLLPSPWRVSKLAGSHLLVRGTMKRRSFIKALGKAGVPKAQVYRILKAMKGVRKLDRTGKRDKFAVAMKRGTKKVVAFEYEIDPTEVYQARTNKEGLLRGLRLDMKVRSEEFATSFYVGKSFTKSYKRAGLEPGLSRVVNAAFNGRTSTEAFEEGGTVRIVVVEQTALGRFVRYERVRVLEYRPPDPSRKPLRAYWFQGQRVRGYADERGRRPSNRGWRSPIPNAPITSHFNPKRMHPVLKRVMPHNGTDYGAPSGTPVYAAYRGTVALIGPRGASGNLVLVDHPGGIQTGYAHLSRFAKGLKRGDKVGTRQLVGYVGSTGRSTGPHLHFTAKKNGKFMNALKLRMDALHVLPVAERAAFLAQKQLLDRALEAIALPEPPEPEPVEPPPADSDPPVDPTAAASSAPPDEGTDDKTKSSSADDQPKGQDDGNQLLGEDLSGDID